MVVGFNHNFNYKGQTYHVQTEDSGIRNPHIITLLYRGGTILASKKTSYADIIKVDHLESVVEELMKSQHREMLRLLKNGDFDELLGLGANPPKTAIKVDTSAPGAAEKTSAPPPSPPAAAAPPVVPTAPAATKPIPPPVPVHEKIPEKKPADASPVASPLSLDDIILSYMVGEDRKK